MLATFELTQSLSGANSLSLQKLHDISNLVQDYRHAQGNYCGASLIQRSEMLAHIDALQFKRVVDDLHTTQQDQRFIRTQNWQTAQQLKLLSPEFWAQIKQPHLHQLKSFIDDYSCYTTEALKMAALYFLPSIEKHIKEGLIALQQKVKENHNDKAYQQTLRYLNTYLVQIEQEKKRLATTLFHRLVFAAHNKDLTWDDVLYGVTATLIKHEIKGLTLPAQRRQGLTPHGFQTFYQYICEQGTKAQQQQLTKLTWAFPKNDYHYVIRGHACLLVPAAIANNIPRSRGFAFQAGKNSRYTTAIAMQPLLQKLLAIHQHTLLSRNGSSPALTAFANLHQELTKTIAELEAKKQKGFFSFLFKQSNNNLQQWQTFCQQQQQNLIEQQVSALEAISAQITQWQDSALIAQQAKLTQGLRIQLNEAVNNVERYIDNSTNDSLKERFTEVASKIKFAHPLSGTCQQYLFGIIQGNPPENGKLNTLYRYHRYITLAPENKSSWYDELIAKAVNATVNRLAHRFNQHQSDAANPVAAKATARKLFRDMLIVQEMGSESQKPTLKNQLHNYITTYLQQLLADNPLPEALAAQEGLILVLTKPNSFLADKRIHQSLLQLKQLRESSKHEALENAADELAIYTTKDYQAYAAIRQQVQAGDANTSSPKINC